MIIVNYVKTEISKLHQIEKIKVTSMNISKSYNLEFEKVKTSNAKSGCKSSVNYGPKLGMTPIKNKIYHGHTT